MRVCDDGTDNGTPQVLRNWPLMRALKRYASRENVVTLHLIHKRKWEARMNDGKWFRSLNRSSFCACVKSFGNIYMYGSSHMRFKFVYLLDECYNRPTDLAQKHGKASIGNLLYHFGRIFSDRKAILRRKTWFIYIQVETIRPVVG